MTLLCSRCDWSLTIVLRDDVGPVTHFLRHYERSHPDVPTVGVRREVPA